MQQDILFTRNQHIGIITLARPAALNALTLPMIKVMQKKLIQWEKDASIHAVVIQAEPGKAFCAGGDVRSLYEAGNVDPAAQMEFFWHEYRLNRYIHYYNKPYIALMDGITMGGGVGISLHGSHPVATENFRFAMPETAIGFFPDIGASWLLARCPGKIGLYAALTGNRFDAQQALAARLIHTIIPAEKLPLALHALCEADFSEDAFERVSGCLQEFALQVNAELPDLDKINTFFAADSVEAIFNALEHASEFWAVEQLKSLKTKSPLALKVTFEQIKKAQKLSMSQCIQMDYGLVRHFMNDHDFYEGVRALLIDKDKSPRWQPARLDAVTPQQVAAYFISDYGDLEFITH